MSTLTPFATAITTFAYDTFTVNGDAGAAAFATAKAASSGSADIHGHATK